MKISFKNGSELEAQSVTKSGNSMEVSVINQAVENLVGLFSNESATEKIITEDGQIYEGYTDYKGINVAPGMIMTVTMYQVGKSPEKRLEDVEKTANSNAEQMTQAQEAIVELYEMLG